MVAKVTKVKPLRVILNNRYGLRNLIKLRNLVKQSNVSHNVGELKIWSAQDILKLGEKEDQDDPVKGKFNWKENFKSGLIQGPDNTTAIKKLGKKIASQYLQWQMNITKPKRKFWPTLRRKSAKLSPLSCKRAKSNSWNEQFYTSNINPFYYWCILFTIVNKTCNKLQWLEFCFPMLYF